MSCPSCGGPSPWGLCHICHSKRDSFYRQTGKYINDYEAHQFNKIDNEIRKAKVDESIKPLDSLFKKPW